MGLMYMLYNIEINSKSDKGKPVFPLPLRIIVPPFITTLLRVPGDAIITFITSTSLQEKFTSTEISPTNQNILHLCGPTLVLNMTVDFIH